MKIEIDLTEDAIDAVSFIQRDSIRETISQTINRILETLLSTAADFDEFYGPPRDGKGPSGQ